MNDAGGDTAEEDEGSVKEFILPGYNKGMCDGEEDGMNGADLIGDLGALPLPPLNEGVAETEEDQVEESEAKGVQGGVGEVGTVER